ncbi:probable 28S ribosomal protein S23, mitochondrial [Drosophila ficusphila]|uniref:probable 28S ribosomal protein S23, mitochondrial n=1 Tax=Drosophila ficusphila TaxID=30025 RepID=UPI0007E5EB63|nr:probable 28S ribosomal protein S23, mitochondrial [Drosophila ficusphila]
MAQSRLEKIGTIFTRVQGLLRGGAMKTEDKPIWYDVYAAFPPKLEPRFDRPAPEIPIRKIFYAEDVVRAKLHKQNKPQETISLFDHKRSTQSQQFVQIYQDLKAQGALDEQRIYETALDLLAEQRQQSRLESTTSEESLPDLDPESKSQLLSDFKEAVGTQQTKSATSPGPPKAKKDAGVGINIDSLFKD